MEAGETQVRASESFPATKPWLKLLSPVDGVCSAAFIHYKERTCCAAERSSILASPKMTYVSAPGDLNTSGLLITARFMKG